jgi:hypothetical protein
MNESQSTPKAFGVNRNEESNANGLAGPALPHSGNSLGAMARSSRSRKPHWPVVKALTFEAADQGATYKSTITSDKNFVGFVRH